MGRGQNVEHHMRDVWGQPRKWVPALPVLSPWLEHVTLPYLIVKKNYHILTD